MHTFASLPSLPSCLLCSWSKPDCCKIIETAWQVSPPPAENTVPPPKVAILSLSGRSCQALLALSAFMLATTVHFSPFHFVWGKCNKAAKQWNWQSISPQTDCGDVFCTESKQSQSNRSSCFGGGGIFIESVCVNVNCKARKQIVRWWKIFHLSQRLLDCKIRI